MQNTIECNPKPNYKQKTSLEDIFEDGSANNIVGEKTRLMYIKSILGVNKYATNMAVRGEKGGETGVFPLYIKAVPQTLKYHERVKLETSDNSLLPKIYKAQQKMCEKNANCWLAGINKIQTKCEEGTHEGTRKGSTQGDFHKRDLKTRYERNWFEKLWEKKDLEEGKMVTYRRIKKNFEMEQYLTFPYRKYRAATTRLRISAHTLKIETGRHTTPITPRDKRICPKCQNGTIQDEVHIRDGVNFILSIPI